MEATNYKNLTASAQLKSQQGRIMGFYVNSTSAGTIKLWDSLTASGAVICNTITPAVGFHNLAEAAFSVGLYATIGGTLDVTFFYK